MKAILAFLVVILCFASTGILKNYLHGVPSAFLAFSRIAISLALFAVIFRGEIKKPRNLKMWASFAVSGMFIAIAFSLYLEAFDHAPVADIALLGFVDPLFATLLAGWVLKEKISIYAYGAIALAAAGVFFLLNFPSDLNSAYLGIWLAILSFLAGSANTVLARWEERHNAPLVDVVFFPFAFAALFLLLPAVAEAPRIAGLGIGIWGYAVIFSIGATTALGYYLYDKLMEKYGAHTTDLAVRAGITVVASAASIMILGQGLGKYSVVAGAFLFGASYLIYLEAHKSRKKFVKLHGHTQ